MSGPLAEVGTVQPSSPTAPAPAPTHRSRADPDRPVARGRLRVALDALPVVAVACLALPQVVHHTRSADPRSGALALLSVLLVAPLALRRRFPLSVLAVLCALMLAQAWIGEPAIAGASLLVAVYSVASGYPSRVAVPAGFAAVAAATPIAARLLPGFAWAEEVVVVLAFVLAAHMCGAFVRNRAATITALTASAERLAEEQAENARAAVVRERTMIAREMHDIVAHSLSVMVTLADAAALKVAGRPVEATETMERVAEVGRQALSDSRRVLGILHSDTAGPLSPQPGLSDLATLVEQVDHAGLDAALTVDGPIEAVPAGAALTAYRIAQEATANTLKHARGATRLDVAVTIAGGVLSLRVRDDGTIDRAPADTATVGRGLRGMRERAVAYGGAVTAGPAPQGGWQVLAELPFADSSDRRRDGT